MNLLTILILAIIIFLIAYRVYGSYLDKLVGIDEKAKTPAHTMNDGVDYVPAKAPVLLGHHFASIAGAGPITGPIAAVVFGWLPCFLWIVLGSVFVGAVHDYFGLITSVRHKGKSVGEIIGQYVGKSARTWFLLFTWLTLVLVIAVFAILTAQAFAASGSVATAGFLMLLIALGMGFALYRANISLPIVTVVGVILLIVAIWIGLNWPFLFFNRVTWTWILMGYVVLASILPVWVLLQPRDYLSSFLLYAALIGGVIGIFIVRPTLVYPSVTTFRTSVGYLFPMLFVTIACGAVSGFHSLVASGTTSKQLSNEKDVRMIGYGSMLIEGVLAVVALGAAAILTQEGMKVGLAEWGGAVGVFAHGMGKFLAGLGVPEQTGIVFGSLTVSAFLLTTLDTATRLGRYSFEELTSEKFPAVSNRFYGTIITVVFGGALALTGQWAAIWPLFGSANQLLAGLALMGATAYLAHLGKQFKVTAYPMAFMMVVTIVALINLVFTNFGKGNILLGSISILLLILASFVVYNGFQALSKFREKIAGETK
ncbi:MAG: Carbon starvation protein CstA [candidate division TA06 bacterium 34_109]|uniref:Carbon starvation protein CstA n=1 Tax=candidate division TA06 bacterium 34_109 TaxID=1635277 RepID=A0A117M5N6_UNCT6|nr:MAG: Carbon starvation protein CstA [candidate division TA06 bacterium 34_109]